MPVRKTAPIASPPEVVLRLNRARLKELEAFLVALREPALTQLLEDDAVFASLIDLALSDYCVKQSVLAESLGTSTAAVGRWRTGKNAPAVYGRVHVIGVVADIVAAAIANFRRKTF